MKLLLTNSVVILTFLPFIFIVVGYLSIVFGHRQ